MIAVKLTEGYTPSFLDQTILHREWYITAFAYILRYIDPNFTPLMWIRAMWKLVLAITVALTVMLYMIALLLGSS